MQDLNFSVSFKTRSKEDKDGRYAGSETTGVDLAFLDSDGDLEAAKAQALRVIDAYSTPIQPARLVEQLTELAGLTARRAGTDEDAKVSLKAYAKRLKDYPADVVKQALWPRQPWKFWPTWAELYEILESEMSARRALRGALSRDEIALPGSEEVKEALSPERRAVIAAIGQKYVEEKRAQQVDRRKEAHKKAFRQRFEGDFDAMEKLGLWIARFEDPKCGAEMEFYEKSKDVELTRLRAVLRDAPTLMTEKMNNRLAELLEWEKGLG